ncbi:MAG: bifunctional [glutamate--ammonia ligase]-adenylyl-L-tyrosine phosphorylase/[glutamate--ammonia-ligase] adenylyltransferase [Proteobacteria bacterium]|nr:bifunctional [glutamate--ammonia ligase]-adenylyl-L-tyrosine phosphorylase/[glutamate--ammonia-ligase] adenylyltransferase [Pseudomonadota bacterium]
MPIIDERLYNRFVSNIKDIDEKEKEFFSHLASFSPLSFWIINRLPSPILKEIFTDYSFNSDRINDEVNKIINLEKEDEFSREIRILKYKEFLKLIARDLFQRQSIETTLNEQSLLAITIVNGIYEYTKNNLYRDLSPLTIIAMGKLGSMELNFSSDIDIVYVYNDDNLENVEKYNKWAVKINQLLSQKTDMGFLYRVDNDLRPGGKYSPLAMSASAFLNYYYLYGETWQRLALLRTRFICGDSNIYDTLKNELEGYIFRRYLDFSMIKDLKELKNKIDLESTRKDKEGINIKLGRGGIREAEFFVYTFQIINGGKNKLIREGNISKAIDLLTEHKFLEEETGKNLKNSYLFLRNTENYIQMDEESQRYNIPDGDGFERLIKLMEMDRKSFNTKLNQIRLQVNELFRSLFQDDSKEKQIEKVFAESDDFDKNYLKTIFFETGLKISEEINFIIDNLAQKQAKIPSKYRSYFRKFILLLFKSVSNKGVQKKHLLLMEEFFNRLIKNPIYLPLLVENKNTIDFIANAFFLGNYLVRILINYPETLEFLITEDTIDRKNFSSYYNYLKELVSSAPDFEMKMRLLRQFKNSEWLKIGIMESYGLIDTYEIELFLTNLAEASLLIVYELCKDIIGEKYGLVNEDIAFIGMGKLGSYEMTYFSDIDLIVIYESEDINAGFYNSKLMQRIISALTMVTREGELYKVDMRLRPTGSQGPLVTTFNNFREYHKTSWIFEKQALTRARVLGETTPFSEKVTAEITKILYESNYDKDFLKREIYSMKKKIDDELAVRERERNIIDIKTGAGGLMDIEFIIQYYKLAYGGHHPGLRSFKPQDNFSALRDMGLLSNDKADFLEKNYNFFKIIERNLRIISGFSRNSFLKDEEIISEIIVNLNICMKKEDFFDYLSDIKREIRNIFNQVFLSQ